MRARASLFFLFCVLIWGIGLGVRAEESAGVEIKPTIIEEKADRGVTLHKEFTLVNKSTIEQTYYLITRDITGVGENGAPIFSDAGAEVTGYELSTWLKMSTDPITLQPGAMVQVPVSIEVPTETSPGSHFGGIFVSVYPPKLRQNGAGVGYEVGAIVIVNLSGDVVESARIRQFSTDKLVYGSPTVKFLTRVENPGNTLIRPRGPLEITNMFGKRVGYLTINDNQSGVFPGTTRPFEATWEGDGIHFGRYQAVVGLAYGAKGARSTVSATASFWILPVKIIVPILGAFSLLLLTVYIGVKLYVRRALEGVSTTGGRRVVARGRRDRGLSRLMVVAVTLLLATALFLIGLLFFFA